MSNTENSEGGYSENFLDKIIASLKKEIKNADDESVIFILLSSLLIITIMNSTDVHNSANIQELIVPNIYETAEHTKQMQELYDSILEDPTIAP